MQYYLELDLAIRDVCFESCAFPTASKQLEAIAQQVGVPCHFEFFSYAARNDLSPPEHRETVIPWHDTQVGIDWLNAVTDYIRSNPESVSDADDLLKDLTECSRVLTGAQSQGSKWHFAMDI